MARIEIHRDISADHETVWAALADLGSHTDWMKDAESLVFTTDITRGVGTVMEVRTRVGPLRTIDVMEVTGWQEGRSIGVDHRGLVKGSGTLRAEPIDGRTRVSWVEELRFPWWLGGVVAAWLAKPVLAAIWRGNLKRLEETLSSP